MERLVLSVLCTCNMETNVVETEMAFCQTCTRYCLHDPSIKSSSVDSNNIITTTTTTRTAAGSSPPSTSNNSSYSINNNETIINNGSSIGNGRKGTNCLLSLFSVLDDFDGYTLGDLLRICCDVEVCTSIKLFSTVH